MVKKLFLEVKWWLRLVFGLIMNIGKFYYKVLEREVLYIEGIKEI